MHQHILPLLAALLLTGVLAGCGASGSASTAPTEASTVLETAEAIALPGFEGS